jgi:uncharacterized protein YrrD
MQAKLIKGYPVVDLENGSILGRVNDLIIDPAAKKVIGIQVGEKGFLKGRSQTIFYEQIFNMGNDAITVKSREANISAEEHAHLELLKDYSFLGNGVISSEGNYIAKVQDFIFSNQTGEIESILLFNLRGREKINNKNVLLHIEGVLNLGKDYVIANTDFLSHLSEEEKEEDQKGKDSTFSLELRAIEFTIGKESAHTVRDIKSEIVVEKGQKITWEIIEKARSKGRLYQVLFAAGVGELLEGIDYTVDKLDQGGELLLQAWQNFKIKSRSILKGSGETGFKESEEPGEAPVQEMFDNMKEVWNHLEKEISREGKELAQETKNQMKKFILNKKANYMVRDDEGNVIIEPGEKITEEIIEMAEFQNKLSTLFLSGISQEVEDSLNILGEKIQRIFH